MNGSTKEFRGLQARGEKSPYVSWVTLMVKRVNPGWLDHCPISRDLQAQMLWSGPRDQGAPWTVSWPLIQRTKGLEFPTPRNK